MFLKESLILFYYQNEYHIFVKNINITGNTRKTKFQCFFLGGIGGGSPFLNAKIISNFQKKEISSLPIIQNLKDIFPSKKRNFNQLQILWEKLLF